MHEITVSRPGHKFTAEIFDDFGPIHLERFRKLADFLDALPPEKFNLDEWVTEVDPKKRQPCGTVCCAVGWLPVVDKKNWRWVWNLWGDTYPVMRSCGDDTWLSIERYFAVTEWGAEWFFQSKYYIGRATPRRVANRLRHFANAAEAYLASLTPAES